MQKRRYGTWTKKRVEIIIFVALLYGIWFNLLDSIRYCVSLDAEEICKSIGEIFGGNHFYQPWNVAGHLIPILLGFAFRPLKSELFMAGFLISTAVMDSPLWGAIRLGRGAPLWDSGGDTFSLNDWIIYYYNPIGTYLVWDSEWLIPGFPTAATIFWSLVGRIAAAAILIWWQNRQEARGKEFSLKDLFLRK